MTSDSLHLSPFILHELPDITRFINLPLKSTQRIKYTCFDISRSLIVFGATSGGVYIFNRNPCEFVQLIPNKDGAITKIRISQDEKYVAFANGKGIVTIIINDNTQTLNQSSTQVSREHHGNEVTDMVWNEIHTMLYIGDDTGTVSIFQISNFMTKTIFHSSTSTIMHLDSRICQIDVKQNLLLVSTLTRSYICDTVRERYRQIGQKLREGEYGACFCSSPANKENDNRQTDIQNIEHERKIGEYNVIMNEDSFVDADLYPNVTIYSARPSSRIWEASIDGSVQRTHQFKQILARSPSNIINYESYLTETITNDTPTDIIYNEQAISFPKILSMKNGCIFSHKRDGIYFLNPNIIDHTMWSDKYENIIDCRIFDNVVYIWRGDGKIVQLIFVTIESFLSKCYVDEKYNLCAKLCALYMNYLMSICDKSFKIHILTNLKDKLITDDAKQLLARIEPLLEKLNKYKNKNVLQLKSGIYVVGNNYSSLMEDIEDNHVESPMTKTPETLQALKDLSVSVTDKLSSSTKKLWSDLKIGTSEIKDYNQVENSDDIIFNKTSSHYNKCNDGIGEESLNKNLINESIYKHFRLSMLDEKSKDMNAICHIIDDNACDIRKLLDLLKLLNIYINNLDNRIYQANFTSSYIFLMYLSRRNEVLEAVLQDDKLTQYFIEACICVNDGKIVKNLGCECGYPLPYSQTSQTPLFSDLIETFIEKQWSKHSEKYCYAICKGIPYVWRKILYMRRNEDLINILLLMFQMLDEKLLYSCLPQFTIDTWNKAIQLYATIATNKCLNCGRSFDDISVQDMLSWNSMGAMMMKSVGGRNAIKILEEHSDLVKASGLGLKFFHTCLMVELYEKFDGTLRAKLTDTLYDALEYEDAKLEICKLLRNSQSRDIKYTALPLSVASKSTSWGAIYCNIEINKKEEASDLISSLFNLKNGDCESFAPKTNMKDVLSYLRQTKNGDLDCSLCSLPLDNDVLIQDGGLWIFVCGHMFHGACLDLCKVKLCPSCLSHGRKE